MSKEMAVIAFGIWVIIIPYLGIPGEWRTILTVVTGAVLIILGFFLRAEMLSRGSRHSNHHTFVENGSRNETQNYSGYNEHSQERKKVS